MNEVLRMPFGDGRWPDEGDPRRPRILRLGLFAALGISLLLVGFAAVRSPTLVPPTVPEPSPPAVVMEAMLAASYGGTGSGGIGGDWVPEVMPLEPPEPPIEWADPSTPSPVIPVPEHERVRMPESVRGIYIGAWVAGDSERLGRLIELADETEVNAFVIDVKDVTGEVSYASQVPLVQQVGATRRIKVGDMREMLARLRSHGIYPIARIVVFKDPLLASVRPEWAIQRKDGSTWEDNKGVRWVDSYNRDVWDYNIELAREAIALGFSEVQWDYVRFPDVPGSYMRDAVYPARDGRSKSDGIREFMIYSRARLDSLDVPLTADVFGVTTSARHDVGIGQVWEKMSDVMDVLLPMVYPSHYPAGTWGYDNPNGSPYEIVRKAMGHGVARSRSIRGAAEIRPWLQAFTMGDPEYGPREIRAQIEAVYDSGLDDWILWHPGVRYPRAAFLSEDGRGSWYAGYRSSLR